MSSFDRCPDCENGLPLPRRDFLKTAGATSAAVGVAVSAGSLPRVVTAADADAAKQAPETHVKKLYDALNESQRKEICFDWDYVVTSPTRRGGTGLLRSFISNNWSITPRAINSDFFTKDQQELIRAVFEGVYNPEWLPKIEKQLQDDAGGYGRGQSIAIFGKPGEKFELVMTGRHLTVRCDGNTTEHLAFGGPIFYGHQASRVSGLLEKDGHPGNVFWHQALAANKVFEMLDGKQRKSALLTRRPQESSVGFRGADGKFPGIPIADLSADQTKEIEKVLDTLLEPYRKTDQVEARACLKAQGGLAKCSLAFYQEGDLGDDSVWDNWRLEGPSFVWYYRGHPHVHVWVHIADDHRVKLNARG